MKKYKPRIVDALLKRKLEGKGAVLIEGAKWCGKTTTAEQIAKSVLYMDEPDSIRQNLFIAETNPSALLQGDKPRLIDEWQLAPNLWDTIRFAVDHENAVGSYLLTGSAVPPQTETIHHTGTGRFARLKMRPMSLWESGESSGKISLTQLFENKGEPIYAECTLSLEEIAFLACRGGWPRATEMTGDIALDQAFDYCEAVISEDVSRIDGVRKNPGRVRRLMRSYARNQGTQASIGTICEDMGADNEAELSDKTVIKYIDALKRIYVIENMEAWNPNLRSKTAVRTSETRYFADPSIAAAALGCGVSDLMENLAGFGLIFETMAMRDLRVYAESLDGSVYHYRDKNGLECDAVIHRRNGSYGLAEIKLGGDTLIEEGCKSLNKLTSVIDTEKMKAPAFRMILTATGKAAYKRPDGIFVIPIGCLKN